MKMQCFLGIILSVVLAFSSSIALAEVDISVVEKHDAPPISDVEVINWAGLAVADIMTYGFHDIDKKKKEIEKYFTTNGYGSYMEALKNSQIEDVIKQDQMVVLAALRRAPIMYSRGYDNDQYKWVVVVPVVQTYQNANKIMDQFNSVQVSIFKKNKDLNNKEIGIEQFVVQSVSSVNEKCSVQKVPAESYIMNGGVMQKIHELEEEIKTLKQKKD